MQQQSFTLVTFIMTLWASTIMAKPVLSSRELFKRSVSDLSGDIFLLPAYGNYMLEESDFKPESLHVSHIASKSKPGTLIPLPPHALNMHGVAWDYDVEIPLTFFDPRGIWFKPGQYAKVAVQQDIAPTLAQVIGAAAPSRSKGRVLTEALAINLGKKRPKAIVIFVQDQVGRGYLAAHPGRAKFYERLLKDGATFTRAQVASVDVETSVGHAAIGTGAYPRGHGISGNNFFNPGTGSVAPVYGMTLTPAMKSEAFPGLFFAPTLSDEWLKASGNKPIIFSFSAAARASISMGGHGNMFAGNKKTVVTYLVDRGENAGTYITDDNYYELTDAIKGKSIVPFVDAFMAKQKGEWLGHNLKRANGEVNLSVARASPAIIDFEESIVGASLQELKVGSDEVTDLIWINFKATDYCGHLFGFESEECGQVLERASQAAESIVEQVNGLTQGSYAVVMTADHGAAPLPELSGAVRLSRATLRQDIQKKFDKSANNIDVVQAIASSQLFINRTELAANGFTMKDLVAYLRGYQAPMQAPQNALAADWIRKGKPAKSRFFADVVAAEDLAK